VALLNFPPSPVNGQIYPSSPIAGEKIYQWSSTEQTWALLGTATGAAPGTYGTPLEVPQFTVDYTGRITAVQNVLIQTADTTQLGITRLADTAEAEAGVSDTLAVTPLGLRSSAVYKTDFTAKGNILTASGPYSPVVLPVGTNGQILVADSAQTTGLKWIDPSLSGIVTSVASTLPITVNNTNPSIPVIGVNLATTATTGVVQIGSNIQVSTGVISILNSNTSQKGVVQLNDNLNSTSTTQAATANAARQLYDIATEKLAGIQGSSPITVDNTFPTYPVIGVTAASTTAPGVVQLNDTVTSTSTTQAATANAVKIAYDSAVAVSPTLMFLDDISGQFNGTATNFTLRLNGIDVSLGTNLLVFVGGVPQIPLVSYYVTGTTITFYEAPETGATFIAVTAQKA